MPAEPVIYLDHHATTPLSPAAAETFVRVSREAFANPGSRHQAGRRARRILEESRERIAALLGAEPDEVLFTSGGTESINSALLGLAGDRPATLLRPAGEHAATTETCRRLVARGWKEVVLPLTPAGQLDAAAWPEFPWPHARLATALLAHNETGVLPDLAPFLERCRSAGIPVHIDAVQAVGKIPVDFRALGGTALSFAAHKFYGPRGVGGLLVRRDAPLRALLTGGHQERGRRAGTESVALVAAMACALDECVAGLDREARRLAVLRDRLEAELHATCAPVVVHGAGGPRLAHASCVGFPGVDGEALLAALDLAGVCASLGSTCASGSTEPAAVLLAMGVPGDVARASVRFTLGRGTTDAEIAAAGVRIARVVAQCRATRR